MDFVDGCLAHKVFLHGKYLTANTQLVYLPAELEHEDSDLFKMALYVAREVLQIGPINGIRYGTLIRHYNAFSRCNYAVLFMWQRHDRVRRCDYCAGRLGTLHRLTA